jgi:hypothetical protein
MSDKSDKATERQLSYLAALGLFKGKEMTKGEAGKQIREAKESGVEPDNQKQYAAEMPIKRLLKRRLAREIKSAKAKEYSASDIEILESQLNTLVTEIEEYEEDIRIEKEDFRIRVYDIHASIQDLKGYHKLTKKPTQAEVKIAVEQLDNENHEWEYRRGADQRLINCLRDNFKHLRTVKSRPSNRKKKKADDSAGSCGCLLVVLFLFLIMPLTYCNEDDDEAVIHGGETETQLTPKIKTKPEASMMAVSDILWLNADEYDVMKIKFNVTNNHDFMVSNIAVMFKFYDVTGKKLAEEKVESFSHPLDAGEVKRFDQFDLGKYPKDTMKVVGEVVSVSK